MNDNINICNHNFIEDYIEIINNVNNIDNPLIKKIQYCDYCYLITGRIHYCITGTKHLTNECILGLSGRS